MNVTKGDLNWEFSGVESSLLGHEKLDIDFQLQTRYCFNDSLKVHRYSFQEIEIVIIICFKFQNLLNDLF